MFLNLSFSSATKRKLKEKILQDLAMMSEAMVVSGTQQDPSTGSIQAQNEVQFIKCECCGLTEECTVAYIERIRKGYMGKWVCGLCSEAVKNEVVRSDKLISTEEAFNRLLQVCRSFRSSSPPAGGDPTVHLISAMRHILRRSLDSPRGGLRSMPVSPTRETLERNRAVLARSESCFADL
ncbi:Quinolinate synthase A [Bienertia sinuspersici]